MGLSSAGIGSNLDVDGIVSKLMSVERQPLTKLARREASYQAKLSGFGTLKGALSAFQSAVKGLSDLSKFQGVRVTPADATIATASAGTGATPGNYSLKVTTLAQAQKLVAAGTTSTRWTMSPLMLMPRIFSAAAPASAGFLASFTPPAVPRPPAWTWAFTTTVPPTRRAMDSASEGVDATSPSGMGMPAARNRARPWYSCRFTWSSYRGDSRRTRRSGNGWRRAARKVLRRLSESKIDT